MGRSSAAKRRKTLIDHANAIDNEQFANIAKGLTTYQSTKPPINPSTDQSTNESINPSFSIEFLSSSALTDQQHASVYQLTEKNMRLMYQSIDWGWNDSAKRAELTHTDARFLYVTINQPINQPTDQSTDQSTEQETDQSDTQNDQLIDQSINDCAAFAHIRFEIDDGVPIIYLWELQINQSIQNLGLGRHLLRLIELMCQSININYIVLTCLKLNERAMKFYTALGYTKDETSPDDASYLILSKQID